MNNKKITQITDLQDIILEVIPDMLVLCDCNMTLLDILHPKPEIISMEDSQKLIGTRPTEEHLRNVIHVGTEQIETVIQTRQSARFVSCHTGNIDGTLYHYETILTYLKTGHVLIQLRTIEEESVKRIEAQHLYHFFADVLDNIAIPIAVKSMDTGRYVYWSKKAEIFGRTSGEMVGATEEMFMSEEMVRMVQALDHRLFEGHEKQYQGIEKHMAIDGREHSFMVTRTQFKFGDENLMMNSVLDISELTETQSSLLQIKDELARKNMVLSSVLTLANVISWNGDMKKGTLSCNHTDHCPYKGEGPDEKGEYILSFKDFFSNIHPDYQTHAIDQLDDLIEGRISNYHEVYPVHWYNENEYEWMEVQSSVHKYGSGGEPTQLIGSARIITAQKQMEESLCKAKNDADHSNMLKSAFLANMSHEIRTPLNSIVGFSELLTQELEESEKQEYLSIIQNNNALLLQLIEDILDLSKIEAGTLEFNFADHDLNALMNELEQTSRMKVENPEVEVTCTYQEPRCTIHTDRGRLLQVLHNFINNAAKFTRQGHIYFGFRRYHDDRWYFYVEDTGCGISADNVGKVFDRFAKLNHTAKGTGLGLAISKSIIERLGGEIGVMSAEKQGSTFWFLLPTDSISMKPPTSENSYIEDVQKLFHAGDKKATLLIAEDDSDNYKLIEAMLQKYYKLIHAWNGREAIELFKEQHPCMILMDIKMPEMDGYKTAAAIRKLSADIPILAVTAFAFPEDMHRILSSGFNGYLPKPVTIDELRKKILEFQPGESLQ